MLDGGVPLHLPGAEEPPFAAVDRASPLLRGLAGIVRPSRVSGWAWRTSRQGMQMSTVTRPSTLLNGPVEVPQNEHRGPTPHLSLSNLRSTSIAGGEPARAIGSVRWLSQNRSYLQQPKQALL
jgi:hypothetical protein